MDESDPLPWLSPLYGRTSQAEWERPGDFARARMIATFEYRPRMAPPCGNWDHDVWIVDEREPMVAYCEDCNIEFL